MEISSKQLNYGKWLFSGECKFVAGAAKLEMIPPLNFPEIAFCGLSNVGKSSLLNALTGQKALARTSNTPGRTQQINFFQLRENLMLVDLPGYGYAKVSKSAKASWNNLVRIYLKGRPNLVRVCLLIDSRREIKQTDISIMDMLDEFAINYQVILTKSDKTSKADLARKINNIEEIFYKHTALHPEVLVTSSNKQQGIKELRAVLSTFVKEG